jgi:hypothetical protein
MVPFKLEPGKAKLNVADEPEVTVKESV